MPRMLCRGLCDTITVLTFLGVEKEKRLGSRVPVSHSSALATRGPRGRRSRTLCSCWGGGAFVWLLYTVGSVRTYSDSRERFVERQLERGVFTHTTQHYKQKHTRVTRVSRDRELHRSGATHDRGSVRGDGRCRWEMGDAGEMGDDRRVPTRD